LQFAVILHRLATLKSRGIGSTLTKSAETHTVYIIRFYDSAQYCIYKRREASVAMYQTVGGGDVNVPPLPVRRSTTNRQWPGTPQLPVRHLQSFTQRSRLASDGTELAAAARLNLENLADSSRSRAVNDYRELPTTTTTTAAVRPADGHLVSRETPPAPPPPRQIQLPAVSPNKDDPDRAAKQSEKSPPGAESERHRRESIICQRCGGCRCDECARRQSASGDRRAAADQLCCVRHLVAFHRRRRRYYGDDDDDDDDGGATTTRACGPCRPDCRRRWALLVLLSLCLPCLCLYWPLRCVASGRRVRRCRCVDRRRDSASQQPSDGTTAESVVVDRLAST